MAGSQREYELLFKLTAAIGPNFSSTFKTAVDVQKRLADSTKQINSLQSKIDGYQKASSAIEKNQGKLSQLTAEHNRLQAELQETAQKKKALQKAMETAETEGSIEDYKRLQSELSATEREYDRLKEKSNGNKSQIQQTTATIEQQKKAFDELGQELREAGINTDNLEDANKRLQNSYDKLKSSQENLKRLNEEQTKINQNISSTKLQLAGTIGAFSAVGAALYAGPVQAAQGYETALAKVSTIADTEAVPLEKFSQEILALSNSTGVAATAIAEDVYNAISAGQKSGDAVNFVTNSTMLAKAGFAETSQTLDVLTTILNAYGMSADKVGTVSDMLVQIQNKGKVTVGELSSVMGKIIPTANSYNVSLEQLGATYAIMTSKGIAAAETTTYANSMLNEMGKSGTTADKALRKAAGKGFADLMASGMSLGDVLAILQTEAGKSGKTIADMFGSAEAGKAAVSLLSNGVDGFNASVADMVNSSGMTQSAFDKMAGTTENKMAKAKNSITNLSIVLGQNFLPIVGNVADKVAGLVTKVAEFAQENPKLVQTVLKVAAGLAAFKVAGLGAKLGFLHVQSGIKTVQKVLEVFKGKATLAQIASMGLGSKLKATGGGVLSYFGSIKNALGQVGSAVGVNAQGLVGKILGPFSSLGGKLVGVITKPFSLLGGKLGSVLSGLGGIIARSPLGTIGKVISAGFGKLGSIISPVGNLLKTALGPIGKLGSTILGPLGGIAGKILPVVGVVTAIITVVQLLRNHFDEVRDAIGRIFGEGGLAVFDKIVSVVTMVGETIKSVFSDGNLAIARDKIEEIFGSKGTAVFDGFMNVVKAVQRTIGTLVGFITEHIVPVAEQILSVIVTNVIPGILNGIQAAAPVIMQIVQSIADFIAGIMPVIGEFIAGIMPVIGEIITFIQAYVLPVIQEVFNFIVAEVLPFIVQGIQTLGSIITTVLSAVLPVVQTVFQTIWSIIQPIMQQILTVVQAVLPVVLSIFQNVFSTVGNLINAMQQALSGLIQFITGVFTGNWSQAWEGIKTIFSGVWDAILSICKGVVNGIISAVNGVIRGLNSLKVPDWVPGIGGKGINIPEIPQLAVGSRNTPDTFIAGEKGPELITNAPGRTVYTAAQTQQIMERSRSAAASVAGVVEPHRFPAMATPQLQAVRAPEVATAGGGGGFTITLHNSNTIVVNGDRPDDLEAKLEENNQKILREFEEAIRKKEDDERRSDYE